jgi:hypothetical protein
VQVIDEFFLFNVRFVFGIAGWEETRRFFKPPEKNPLKLIKEK